MRERGIAKSHCGSEIVDRKLTRYGTTLDLHRLRYQMDARQERARAGISTCGECKAVKTVHGGSAPSPLLQHDRFHLHSDEPFAFRHSNARAASPVSPQPTGPCLFFSQQGAHRGSFLLHGLSNRPPLLNIQYRCDTTARYVPRRTARVFSSANMLRRSPRCFTTSPSRHNMLCNDPSYISKPTPSSLQRKDRFGTSQHQMHAA